MTVIIVAAIPISSVRASSTVPWNTNRCNGELDDTLMADSAEPSSSASNTDTPGKTHSAPCRYSHNASRRCLTSAVQQPLAVGASPDEVSQPSRMDDLVIGIDRRGAGRRHGSLRHGDGVLGRKVNV